MARKPTLSDSSLRLNLSLTADQKMRLEDLRKKTGSSSLAEVVRNAIAVYDELLRIQEKGAEVFIHEKGKKKTSLQLVPRRGG